VTKALEQVFNAAAKLPEKEQEAFAALMMEELASEARWADAFARSQDNLAALADEALAEHRAGKTRPFERDSDLSDD
jgi:hypothetical protein